VSNTVQPTDMPASAVGVGELRRQLANKQNNMVGDNELAANHTQLKTINTNTHDIYKTPAHSMLSSNDSSKPPVPRKPTHLATSRTDMNANELIANHMILQLDMFSNARSNSTSQMPPSADAGCTRCHKSESSAHLYHMV
jgi:hypothetical protein